jgi:hypothetical protein
MSQACLIVLLERTVQREVLLVPTVLQAMFLELALRPALFVLLAKTAPIQHKM